MKYVRIFDGIFAACLMVIGFIYRPAGTTRLDLGVGPAFLLIGIALAAAIIRIAIVYNDFKRRGL